MRCGYPLVALFVAIKLRNQMGEFNKTTLLELVKNFYEMVRTYKLFLKQNCDPLLTKDDTRFNQLIVDHSIQPLLKAGILQTPQRFDESLSTSLFNREEEILSLLKQRLFDNFLSNLKDLHHTLELFPDDLGLQFLKEMVIFFLFEWERQIDLKLKAEAAAQLAASYEKIDLVALLKYLYQSYSLNSMNKLINYFRISQQELDTYFSGAMDLQLDILKKVKSQVLDSSSFLSMPAPLETDHKTPPLTPASPEIITTAESAGEPEAELEGEPEAELEGEPEAELEGEPEAELEGKPEAELEGKPEAELEGKPEAKLEMEPDIFIAPKPVSEKKIKVLTEIYQQMSQLDVEEDYRHKRKEKKQVLKEAKAKLGFFKKLKKKLKKS